MTILYESCIFHWCLEVQSPWLSALWGSAPAVQATVLSSVFTSLCAAVGLPVPSVQRALVSRVRGISTGSGRSAFMRKKRGPMRDEGMNEARRSVPSPPVRTPGTTIFARAAALRMRSFLPHVSNALSCVAKMHLPFWFHLLRASTFVSQVAALRPAASALTRHITHTGHAHDTRKGRRRHTFRLPCAYLWLSPPSGRSARRLRLRKT